ncbi:MAG: zf-HC2 domain-containing protein [Candidatus Coatesbacteria bacterium]|nr:zf-HC2 domain-containing protein [Candidatus Coatesbacteria bacterium]
MNHNEYKDELSRYFDNELSSDEKDLMEKHIVKCDICRSDLDKFNEIGLFINDLEVPEIPSSLTEDILSKTRFMNMKRRRAYFSIAAAAMLFGIISGLILGFNIIEKNSSPHMAIKNLEADLSVDSFSLSPKTSITYSYNELSGKGD